MVADFLSETGSNWIVADMPQGAPTERSASMKRCASTG